MVTSASTRAVMSATAGLARRIASCTESADDDAGAASAASVKAAPARRFMLSHPITERHGWIERPRSVSPARGVVETALLVGEPVTRLEMREQVDQPQVG